LVVGYSALKREASEKWFKKYKFCFFIKPKNPLGVEWVFEKLAIISITLAQPEYAPDAVQPADAASCS
jgi:hypothetical protein